MKKHLFRFVLFSFLMFLVACNKPKANNEENELETNQLEIDFIKEGTLNLINQENVIKTIEIEIASDDYERQNGLMNRSKIDENKGMLFIFEEPKIQQFWMKNTRIPLDIIYLDENKKVINIARNTEPYLETGVPPSATPAKYVLEVNGGSSDKWGIKEGVTQIDWQEINKN